MYLMANTTVNEIASYIEALAPKSLAESWDNVGLLVGDGDAEVNTCLLYTSPSPRDS